MRLMLPRSKSFILPEEANRLIMVGTNSVCVTFSFSIKDNTCSTSKRGTMPRATSQCHCKGAGHVGQMKHRPGVHVDGVSAITHFRHHIQRIENQIVMAEHHALGASGGAAGIEQASQFVVAGAVVVNGIVI